MKFCSNCGNEVIEEAVICVKCGCAVGNSIPKQASYPNKSGTPINESSVLSLINGLSIFSFFVPLIGLVLYFANTKSAPKKAKALGKSALFGFVFALVLNTLIMSIYSTVTFL